MFKLDIPLYSSIILSSYFVAVIIQVECECFEYRCFVFSVLLETESVFDTCIIRYILFLFTSSSDI